MKKTPFFLILGVLFFMFSCENEKLDPTEPTVQEQSGTVLNLNQKYTLKNIENALASGSIKIPINDNLIISAQNLKKVENISTEGENPFFNNMISYVSNDMVVSYNEEELFLNYSDNDLNYVLSYSIEAQRASNKKGLKASDNLVNIIEQEHFTLAITDEQNNNKNACNSHKTELSKTNNNSSSLRRVDDKDWKIYLYYDKEYIEDYSKFKVNVKSSLNFFKKAYAFVDEVNIKFRYYQKKGIYANISDVIKLRLEKYLKKKKKKKSHRIYVFLSDKAGHPTFLPPHKPAGGSAGAIGKKEGYRYAWSSVTEKTILAHEVGHTLGATHNDKRYKKNGKSYYSVMHTYKTKKIKGFKRRNGKIVKNTLRNED